MGWLNSWNSFVRVVELGSMAAAARSQNCTRAQISKQMAELERALGRRLFERSTRKLGLTPSGNTFYQHALRALEAVASAEVAVRNPREEPRGVLRIAATITFGRMHVAPLLPGVVARHPELNCELILSDQVVDLVDDNIDVALRMTNVPPEDAIAKELVDIKRMVCAAPAYLAAHGTPQTLQDLAQHVYIGDLPTDGHVWRLTDTRGQECSIPMHSRIRFNNDDCLLDAVMRGYGLAILPTYLCGPEIAKANLIAVLDQYQPEMHGKSHIYVCYTPSRVRASKVRLFVNELVNCFQPVPPWEKS